jgi:hypothetical protein
MWFGEQEARDIIRRNSTVMPGEVVANKAPTVCMDTPEGFNEAIRWSNRGDFKEVLRTIRTHGGQLLAAGARMKILDTGILKTRVRITETDRECYVAAELAK